jgi:hypothetical protein
MDEMARVNRSRRLWFAALLAVAAAAVVAVRSCGSDAPPASEPGASTRPDADESARPPVQPAPRPRRRSAAESAPSTTDDAARRNDPAPSPSAGAPTAPAATAKLHEVRVLRADGTPAAGATIALDQRPLWDDWPGPHMWMFRGTDADGQAQLPRRDAPLYVRQGSDVGWTYKPGSVVPLPDVRLRPGVVVRGRTIDSDALPVASANVRAEMFPPGAGGSIVVETTSNAQGEFELPPLPFDEHGNGRQDIEIVAYADGLVPGSATTTRADAPKGPIVVTLYRGGALRGRLVRADKRPLSRVRVLLAGTHIAASPDEEGRFALRLPADGGEVIVQDAFFATSESVFRPAAGTFVAARRLGAFRGDVGDRDLGDVVVDGGKPLRGVVVLMKSEPGWEKAFPAVVALLNGDPVAGARVTAVLAGVEILSVTTDAKGAFELPLSGDEHDLVVNERSSNRISRIPAVEGVRGGGLDVRIVRGRMGIRVRLRDENGARIEPAGVHLQASPHGQVGGTAYADGYHGLAELDAARSELRVQLPVEGAYDLEVHSTRYEFEIVVIESIDVSADRDAEIDVRLRRKP